MKIVSGKTGTPHVTSQQFRQIIEGICGQDSYILGSGENLKPELASNNILKIRSGMMCHHGNVSSVDIGTYDEVELPNGSQGMKRIVLIVNRYTKNENTGVESDDWVVISGTPAESDPVAPEYTEGNLQNGDLVDDCPVFEVHYDGINVTEVKKLLPMVPNINELNSKLVIKNVTGTTTAQGNLVLNIPPDKFFVISVGLRAMVCVPYITINGDSWAANIKDTSGASITNKELTVYVAFIDLEHF